MNAGLALPRRPALTWWQAFRAHSATYAMHCVSMYVLTVFVCAYVSTLRVHRCSTLTSSQTTSLSTTVTTRSSCVTLAVR